MLKQRFTARRGQGAFLNGEQIHVSGQTDLAKVLVTTEFGTTRDGDKLLVTMENLKKIVQNVHG